MDKQDKTADWYYKCCKCGKTLSLHSGITCTQPMAVRTSGICGGSTTQEITKEEYFETLYKWSEDRTAELEAKIKEAESNFMIELKMKEEAIKLYQEASAKIKALEERLEAADEVIEEGDSPQEWDSDDYWKALEKYQSIKLKK